MPSYIHLPREHLLSFHRGTFAHALVAESGLATNWADKVQTSPSLKTSCQVNRLLSAVPQA